VSGIVIVGGGAIGCATAFFLARAGADVTLIERAEIGGESTGASAGMLVALSDEGPDRGPAFQSLCLDGLMLYESLLPELEATGIDLRYRRIGVLHLALDEEEARRLRHRFESQQTIAPENCWLEGRQITAEEPQANPRAVAALLSPDEHYLDPRNLALTLAEASRRKGVSLKTGESMTRMTRKGERLTLRTESAAFEPDAVVLAAGPWTAAIAQRLGVQVPVRPVRGQMASLSGPAEPLRHMIWGERAYLVPREGGQTYVGASVEEAGYRKRTTRSVIERLQRHATALVPSLGSAPRLREWAGLRPASPDGLPIMGLLPGTANIWVATGHFRNGILLAAITGQLMAESVLEGRPAPRLAPFSPDRFIGG
jgi:glycine oxidase